MQIQIRLNVSCTKQNKIQCIMKAISLGFCVFFTFYLGQCMVINLPATMPFSLYIYIFFGKALTCTCVRIEPQEKKKT